MASWRRQPRSCSRARSRASDSGLAVTRARGHVYRATALLEVAAAADPRVPAAAQPLAAAVLAESYAELLRRSFLAGIAPQVAGGRFDAGRARPTRVDAGHAGDSAVVESPGRGPHPAGGAGGRRPTSSSAFVALVQQLSRQRTSRWRTS